MEDLIQRIQTQLRRIPLLDRWLLGELIGPLLFAIAMFTVRARQSPDETPTQRFVVVDAERGDLAYAEAFDDDDDDAARDASGPAPAEPDVDAGTRGGEGERGEEGEAGNANPDGKKTRGGADASAETAAREL